MIRRLLIANRGEIAVRIARAARALGIVPLGVYSEADASAYHLRFMDDAICIGPAPATESYLRSDALVDAARRLEADALHPGYGFLSERADFARAVRDAGLVFVGPPPEAMEALGSKIEAKRRARAAAVPVVPGYDGDDQSPQRLRTEAERIGTPLLIKASAGGGGRGMRVVEDLSAFDEALASAKREALAAFGDETVLLERYLRAPRHIEFQILADAYGTVIHLGERECSIQRRHQKIIEEAPSPALTPELRAAMGDAAVRAARSVGYVNAGTVEFVLDGDDFYFLEVNARLQVEHPVTELVHGIDLVQWQLRIAGGEPLRLGEDVATARGWAIEARICAEDPFNDLLPATGTITHWEPPSEPYVRVDAGVTVGSEVGLHYDSLLAKLIVGGRDRAEAIARMDDALAHFRIQGVRTNIPLLQRIVRDPVFRSGAATTAFLAERAGNEAFAAVPPESSIVAAAAALLASDRAPWRPAGIGIPLHLRCGDTVVRLEADRMDGGRYSIRGALDGVLAIAVAGPHLTVRWNDRQVHARITHEPDAIVVDGEARVDRFDLAPAPSAKAHAVSAAKGGDGPVTAPMAGKISKIFVQEGEPVEERTPLFVLEAMKMEHRILAPRAGIVRALHVQEGRIVQGGDPLAEIDG